MKKVLFFSVFFIPLFIYQSCRDKVSSFQDSKNSSELKVVEYNDSTFHRAHSDMLEAKRKKDTLRLGKIYFEIGYYYFDKNKKDSAFYYFNQSKEEFLLKRDSSYIGISLLNMAIIQGEEGDFYGSEEMAVEALKFLVPMNDSVNVSSVYNCLAISKAFQKSYNQAVEYYEQSLKYSTDEFTEFSIKNNLAVANIKNKDYLVSIQILSDLSKNTKLDKYPALKAKVGDNLAYARWLENPEYNAEAEFYKNLGIREKEEDLFGQITSHLHLSEYYSRINNQKAVFHAKKMYKIANQVLGLPDKLDALQRLIISEEPENVKKYFDLYVELNDSLQTSRNRAKNQFALIRYEVEKNKEENLQLRAENAYKNYQILKQRVTVFSIIIIVIIGVAIFIFWYRRRRNKFKQEKIEEVHRTELKYSKKVHDEVANGIYFLLVQLENSSEVKSSKIIDDLEELYNKSRNISHDSEFNVDLENDFANVLRDMLQPYGMKSTKIIIIGNNSQVWDEVSVKKREEIYYVLKELMTNMKKHSQANLVTLKFKRENKVVSIDYFDNGMGVTGTNWKPGKGLKNIETRINSIQGTFHIDTENTKGFSVKIVVVI